MTNIKSMRKTYTFDNNLYLFFGVMILSATVTTSTLLGYTYWKEKQNIDTKDIKDNKVKRHRLLDIIEEWVHTNEPTTEINTDDIEL